MGHGPALRLTEANGRCRIGQAPGRMARGERRRNRPSRACIEGVGWDLEQGVLVWGMYIVRRTASRARKGTHRAITSGNGSWRNRPRSRTARVPKLGRAITAR